MGITLDKRDIFLVSINETVDSVFKEANKNLKAAAEEAAKSKTSAKRNVDNGERPDGESTSSPRKRKRRRGSGIGSRDGSVSPVARNNDKEQRADESVVNIKTEDNDTRNADDGRKFHPAHDETSNSNQSQICDTKPVISNDNDNVNVPANDSTNASSDDVTVKQEPPEDEVYMIDDDSDAGSDVTSYSHGDNSMGAGFNIQGWAQPDGSGQGGI